MASEAAAQPNSPDGHGAISLSEPQLPHEPCPASPIKKLPHMVSVFLSLRFYDMENDDFQRPHFKIKMDTTSSFFPSAVVLMIAE